MIDEVSGDADAAEPPVVETEIENSTQVKDLSEQDQTAVCDAVTNALNAGVSPNDKCDVAGLLSAARSAQDGLEAVRAACAEVADTCRSGASVAAVAMSEVPPIEAECGLFSGETSACETETGTLLECLTDLAAAMVTSIGDLSCETLTIEGLMESVSFEVDTTSVPETPTCLTVQMECPGVFGAGASSDTDEAAAGGMDTDVGGREG